MSEASQFTITVEQLEGLAFKVVWDWDTAPPLLMDEPEPIGKRHGPNAARLLGAAIGNCLTASLTFCLQRSRLDVTGMTSRVTGTITRSEGGRLRAGAYEVEIRLPESLSGGGAQLGRCLGVFEDYCIVTSSVRQGIPVRVRVVDAGGAALLDSGGD
jgi:uncharacterized OsmC-like protein